LATRQRIVTARLAFDADPAGFIARQAPQESALRDEVSAARARLKNIEYSAGDIEKAATLCSQAQVEGVRADLALLRAARANASLDGRSAITEEDLNRVAPWVLNHRRHDSGRAESSFPSMSPPGTETPADAGGASSNDGGGATHAAQTNPGALQMSEGSDSLSEIQNSAQQIQAMRGSGPSVSPGQPGGVNERADADESDEADWGAMRGPRSPPDAGKALQVKSVRPLPAKKP
ncbi:MAG: hypothetical protein AAGF46_09710, partial [Pseudomonadota bacterium]